jgi:hypothetical protein
MRYRGTGGPFATEAGPAWLKPMRTTPRSYLTPASSMLLLAGLGLLASPGIAQDDESGVLTAVFAKTDKSYKRQKDADGKWVREYYAMTNGGTAEGTIQDTAQEKVKFVSIATVLAQHLARQGYFPATDKDKVDLLLVVNWGRTMPFTDGVYREGMQTVLSDMNSFSAATQAAAAAPPVAQGEINLTGRVEDIQAQAAESALVGSLLMQDMMNRSRNQANAKTAHLLGYMGDINGADGIQRFAGGGRLYDDLVADIEEARYYIILSAYDFKKTVRENKPKIQWVTRMSMRAPGNSFAEKAASMIAYSASRFGQDTDGLERKLYPAYKVNLEDIRFLGVAEQTAPGTPAAPKTEDK